MSLGAPGVTGFQDPGVGGFRGSGNPEPSTCRITVQSVVITRHQVDDSITTHCFSALACCGPSDKDPVCLMAHQPAGRRPSCRRDSRKELEFINNRVGVIHNTLFYNIRTTNTPTLNTQFM